ncbi:MAG TPA: aminotransferase class IV [Gemmatimonadales bacterium]|jgi:D-alanine transaminase
MTVFFNGQYMAKDQVRISPEDRGFLFADGIYEVIRSYDGKLFRTADHLARMKRGLAALEIRGVDTDAIGAAAGELVRRNDLTKGSATIYVQVSRGAAPRTHFFPDPPATPTVYASASALKPKGDPVRGVSVITVPDTRWARCDIKSVSLLPNTLANEQAHKAGVIEAIFVRDGVALEGTSSTFFAVVDGELRTAPLNNYVLGSITRIVVLELCRSAGLAYAETPVFVTDLPRASEMFLASTTVEVMPITTVDGRPVGDGKPGPVARRLRDLFATQTS